MLSSLTRPKMAPATPTIADELADAWRAASDDSEHAHPSPRTVTPALASDPDVDGSLLMGLSYVTDYRCEEERGVADLRTAVTGQHPRRFQMIRDARNRMTVFTDVTGFAISTRGPLPATAEWGTELGSRTSAPDATAPDYAKFWDDSLGWAQGTPTEWQDRRTVPYLRTEAKAAGISPLPRTKQALRAALREAGVDAPAKYPSQYPAWFHYGTLLVVRADTGVTQQVVARLCAAIDAGTFGIGNGSGVFHSGVFLYDAADDTAELVTAREARFNWHDARMTDLKPVQDELRRRGHRWYFLGNPREQRNNETPAVRYWLSGSGSPQPRGWYTLDELQAEKFLNDARDNASRKRTS